MTGPAPTGNEQVRSVVAHLAGDRAAADEVHLVLPETGVCSVGFATGVAGGRAADTDGGMPLPAEVAVRAGGSCCG